VAVASEFRQGYSIGSSRHLLCHLVFFLIRSRLIENPVREQHRAAELHANTAKFEAMDICASESKI
jgi:hypothetical protein